MKKHGERVIINFTLMNGHVDTRWEGVVGQIKSSIDTHITMCKINS